MSGRLIRVDVSRAEIITEADVDAILAATQERLTDEDVCLVQFIGPLVSDRPPKGLAAAVQALYRLTRRCGRPLLVGPT
jgi:hypothetical protein